MENTATQPQVNINDLVTNISNQINETLNQRLSPIEAKLNQPTAEQIEEQNERIRQQFENNPMEFVKGIQEQAKQQAMQELQPQIQQVNQLGNKLSWQDKIRQFTSQNPEASKYMPQITEVLKGNPSLMGTSNPLDSAYKMAVANNLLGNGGNVVQGILGNEDYKAQIMQNPELKQAIIQEYQNQLNGGGKGLPPIMGNAPGGSIPASGGEVPRSLKEAKQAALRRLQG